METVGELTSCIDWDLTQVTPSSGSNRIVNTLHCGVATRSILNIIAVALPQGLHTI